MLLLALALPAWAETQWLLSSPETKWRTGAPFSVTVVGDEHPATPMPDALPLTLQSGTRTTTVMLQAAGPASGVRRTYQATWPLDWVGATTLRLAQVPSTPLLVVADNTPWMPQEDPVARMAGAQPGTEDTPRDFALSTNEPSYFLLGANGGANARFQLSFKYRILDATSTTLADVPVFHGLYFGYTQTSLWDLSSTSVPFYDTSYRPSLFYQWTANHPNSGHKWVLQTGLEHESNGKKDEDSRSINTVFAKFNWRKTLDAEGYYIGVIPKVWAYLEKSDNIDIQSYRGVSDIGIRYGKDDGWVGQLNVRRGTSGRGSTQFDLSYPLSKRIFDSTGAFIHLQYFDGYGETLLDYNMHHAPQLRLGVSLVR